MPTSEERLGRRDLPAGDVPEGAEVAADSADDDAWVEAQGKKMAFANPLGMYISIDPDRLREMRSLARRWGPEQGRGFELT